MGLEEDLFPSMLSKNSRSDLEEERRLFYVALTRAKVKATLSFAVNRFRWGNLIQCEPSRFLDEIDPSYLKNVSSKPESSFIHSNHGSPLKNKFFSKPHRLKKVSKIVEKLDDTNHQNTNQLKIGDEVQHERADPIVRASPFTAVCSRALRRASSCVRRAASCARASTLLGDAQARRRASQSIDTPPSAR